MHDLTICTVNCGTSALVGAIWNLTASLNSRLQQRWVVVDTTPAGRSGAVAEDDVRFHMVRGEPLPSWIRSDTSYLHGINIFSCYHGAGLNQALRHVNTRWVLFLDPDFCIVAPEFLGQVTEHMEQQGVALFGAQYHPRMTRKYLNFPTAICMFVDLQQVPLEQIDFMPELRERNFFTRSAERYLGGFGLGPSRDVGWQLYSKYGQSRSLRSECLQISWRRPAPRPRLRSRLRRLYDDLVMTCRLPKGYVTERMIGDFGGPDPSCLGGLTDEYFWRGRPFGFHIRCRVQQEVGFDHITGLIDSFSDPDVLSRLQGDKSAVTGAPASTTESLMNYA